jgi:7-cyano-7-deazaguanine synthase
MERALNLGLAQNFRVETPLMRLTKAETWALAKHLGGDALVEIVRADSHTCYLGERGALHDWGHGCGTCPACELRAKGWNEWVAEGRPALAA